jgi:outer membrane biosynthesis protein TonB
MRHSVRHAISRRWIFALSILVLLFSMASGVWALPTQRGLRQTVPTRTPTSPPPTDTPVPPTVTPVPPTSTPVPPTATPKPKKKDEPKAPTAAPTQVVEPTQPPLEATEVAEPTLTAEAAVTATVIASAGFPVSGVDLTPLIAGGAGLLLATCFGVYCLARRRSTSGQ